jgi:hypothetical protein
MFTKFISSPEGRTGRAINLDIVLRANHRRELKLFIRVHSRPIRGFNVHSRFKSAFVVIRGLDWLAA